MKSTDSLSRRSASLPRDDSPTDEHQMRERVLHLGKLSPEDMLEELLAVIHGDGGHYSDEHGLAKAVARAEVKWYALAASPAIPQGNGGEPVAVIGAAYQVLWCRQDWSKGLKVGDKLYAATQPVQGGGLTPVAPTASDARQLLQRCLAALNIAQGSCEYGPQHPTAKLWDEVEQDIRAALVTQQAAAPAPDATAGVLAALRELVDCNANEVLPESSVRVEWVRRMDAAWGRAYTALSPIPAATGKSIVDTSWSDAARAVHAKNRATPDAPAAPVVEALDLATIGESVLRNPVLLEDPDGEFTDETGAKWAWFSHGYETGMTPYYSAEQVKNAMVRASQLVAARVGGAPAAITDEQIDALHERAITMNCATFGLNAQDWSTDTRTNGHWRRAFARALLAEPKDGTAAEEAMESAHLDWLNSDDWSADPSESFRAGYRAAPEPIANPVVGEIIERDGYGPKTPLRWPSAKDAADWAHLQAALVENDRLPYDVKVGGGTFRKGVALSTFIEAARRWHREAFPDFYTLTDEDKARNLARLMNVGVTTPAMHVDTKVCDCERALPPDAGKRCIRCGGVAARIGDEA